jgi:uncharacterized membrane protein
VAEDREEREERHRFARRLEAFSDIVFGFALAQCAFALEVPSSLADVPGKSFDLIFFAVTFALIGAFWVMHYRIFHYVFTATRLQVALNFGLLAVVALLPYALRIFIKWPQSVAGSVAYAAALGAAFSLMAVLETIGLRDRPASLSANGLRIIRRAVWRHTTAGAVFVISLPLFLVFGADARNVWALIAPAMVVGRLIERARQAAAVRGTPAPAAES